MVRAVEIIIKWLVCSVFSVNLAQAEFFLFLKYPGYSKLLSGFKANIIIAHTVYSGFQLRSLHAHSVLRNGKPIVRMRVNL